MNENTQLFGNYQPPTALEKVANGLRRAGHAMSMIPLVGLLGGPITLAAAAVDTVDGFLNKSFAKGTKNAVSGVVDGVVTGFVGSTFWMSANWISGIASGDSLGELARKGTKGILDSVIGDGTVIPKETELARQMQVLGPAPITYGYAPAAVGYAQDIPQQVAMQAPLNPSTNQPMPANYWADKEAQRRGQTPEDARANWIRNNHEDAVALRNAAQQDAQIEAS